MMLLSRAQPAIAPAQRRNVSGFGSSLALPARPSLICRFKDGDELKEDVKKRASTLKDNLKDSVPNELKSVGERITGSIKDTTSSDPITDSIKRGAAKSQMDAQFTVNWFTPAFTRRREVFAGRLAMVGFFMACFWEYILPSHPNIIQQVSGFTGFELSTVFTIIAFGIAYNTVGAFVPGSPTYSEENQRDVQKRLANPPEQPITTKNANQFLGITGLGFTKPNEVFAGRLAMIGFLAAIIAQMSIGGLTGPGPLAQVAYYLNLPVDSTFYSNAGLFFLGGVSLLPLALSFVTGNIGTNEGEEDIY